MYAFLLCMAIFFTANAQPKRAPLPADVYRLQDVNGIQVSPDGKWIAYTVSTVDTNKDNRNEDIWMISWDGKENLQLTGSEEDESMPRWSPDGKYISFLSSRAASSDDDNDAAQIWLLDRRGGEGKKISAVKGEIQNYAWSPDGKKILLQMKDEDFFRYSKSKIHEPFVMDRFHFKQDYIGYLDHRAVHLYLLDASTGNIDTLTKGNYDEVNAAWSPDGKMIAFASNRSAEPDKNEDKNIYVMNAAPGASMKALTSWKGDDDNPQWSPDGNFIAYTQSSSDEAFTMYGEDLLAVISKDGGEPKLLSKAIDRPVINPQWSKDGKSIAVLMENDRQVNIVSFDAATGATKNIASGDKVFYELQLNPATGNWATLMGNAHLPFEVGKNRRHIRNTINACIRFFSCTSLACKCGRF